MTALGQLKTWPDAWGVTAAAAVVTPAGVVETAGDLDRPVRLASVTKLLSAAAVMLGVQEEAVALDDPAGPPGATLRHLLAHTSGYAFESDGPEIARPGTRRIYSNRGIETATAHLEAASGIPFAGYLQEGLLGPLGMTVTRLEGSTAFAVTSTVADLVPFAAELLRPTLLHPATWADMVAVQFPGLAGVLPGHGRFDPLDWGLGPERNFSRPGHWAGAWVSPDTFGHFGATGTFLWVDPRAQVACVSLAERDFGEWARQSWPPLCDAVIEEYGVRT